MLNNILADIVNALKAFTLGDFLDILLVAFILYSFFRLIKAYAWVDNYIFFFYSP